MKKPFPLLVLAVALLLTGCASTDSDGSRSPSPQPGQSRELRVGIYPENPPLIYREKGRYLGLEADLAQMLAEFTGRPLRFVPLSPRDFENALLSKDIDILMSGLSQGQITHSRLASSHPYMTSGQAALIRTEDRARFESIATSHARAGVVQDSTADHLVRQLIKTRPETFSTPDRAVRALLDKRIDFFLYDAPAIWQYATQGRAYGVSALPYLLTEEKLVWMTRTEDLHLLLQANTLLETLHQKGLMAPLIDKWLPDAPD